MEDVNLEAAEHVWTLVETPCEDGGVEVKWVSEIRGFKCSVIHCAHPEEDAVEYFCEVETAVEFVPSLTEAFQYCKEAAWHAELAETARRVLTTDEEPDD